MSRRIFAIWHFFLIEITKIQFDRCFTFINDPAEEENTGPDKEIHIDVSVWHFKAKKEHVSLVPCGADCTTNEAAFLVDLPFPHRGLLIEHQLTTPLPV